MDYAVMRDGEPVILVEAKAISEKLEKHDSQLFRYFGTTKAKFAILTNGAEYRFYTDLEQPNKMDETPFLSIDILNVKENQIPELRKFHKSVFDVSEIFDTASILKYASIFKHLLAEQLTSPSDEFVRLFLQEIYSGVKTQAVVEKFRPILKKSLNDFISETMNDKIKSALGATDLIEVSTTQPEAAPVEEEDSGAKIITTQAEMEAFFLLKNILRDTVEVDDVTYKDTLNYFGCLYKGNTRKWICRFIIRDAQSALILPNADKSESRYTLPSVFDLNNYKEQLIEVAKRYM